MKRKIKVIHLFDKRTGEHKYFGSIASIFDENLDIGITYGSLRNYGLSEKYYENDKVIIRQGYLINKEKKQ